MMEEIWKICPLHENYECSNTGKIRNKKTLRELKYWISNGYFYCRLGAKIKNLVHRIIGYTFLDLADNLQIDHIDRNRQNNNLENLRVVTSFQNQTNKNTKNYRVKNVFGYIYYEVNMTIKQNEPRFIQIYKTKEEAINKVIELKKIYRTIA
jgi:hypothetical protein